jgi:hypothetical protein
MSWPERRKTERRVLRRFERLVQHGWKARDGFGLEWFKRKEQEQSA